MYQTSKNYKELVYADSTQHLLKIYIEGQEVDPNHILDFKVSHILFSNDEFTFGSVTARTIEFKIYKNSLPEIHNNFYVETGVGEEIVPIGYFTLEDIKKDDDYTVTITAIDYMVKFEFNYDGSEITYPATMIQVLRDICSKAGVECGSTSFLNSDKTIAVYDNTVSARTYISYIAEQAGSFAFIGRDGKLYIKKIGEDTEKFNIEYFQNYTWGEEFAISEIDYEDGVRDIKINGEKITVDFINSHTVEEINKLLISRILNEKNNTVWISQENMYIVDEDQIQKIYNEYQNFSCYSFEGSTIIDPAYDIGDILIINGKKVIYQGDMNYVGKFKADIKSNIQPKIKEETMNTISTTAKIRRIQSSIDQINGEIKAVVEEVDDNNQKITETLQTVSEVLTTVQEYVNLTQTVNGLKTVTISDAIAGSLYGLRIIGNNIVFKPLCFDSGTWTFDGTYYFANSNSTVMINNTIYDLGISDVLRQLGTVYDEYIYDYKNDYARVIRRIGVNANDELYVLENEIIEELEVPNFELTSEENTITIINFSANMQATYIAKSDYTDLFVTDVELQSSLDITSREIKAEVSEEITTAKGDLERSIAEVSIKADEIDEEVKQKVGDEEVIAKLNLAVKDKQGIIELLGNIVKITSDYFTLDENGNIVAKSGTIGGLTIQNNTLYKNYTSSGSTYNSGFYVPETTAGNTAFIFAGHPANGRSYAQSNMFIHHDGNMFFRSGCLNMIYEPTVSQNGSASWVNALSFNANGTTRRLSNGNHWTTEGVGFINNTPDSHCLFLYDAPRYVIQDALHGTALMSMIKTDAVSQNAITYLWTDLSIWGTRQIDGITNSIYIQGYEVATNASDERLKENIVDSSDNALKTVMKILIRSFDWRKDKHLAQGGQHIKNGYIAQEVLKADDTLVNYNKENDTYQMNLLNLSGLHTKAIQELNKENEDLKEQISNLEKQNETLKKLIEELTTRIEKIENKEENI